MACKTRKGPIKRPPKGDNYYAARAIPYSPSRRIWIRVCYECPRQSAVDDLTIWRGTDEMGVWHIRPQPRIGSGSWSPFTQHLSFSTYDEIIFLGKIEIRGVWTRQPHRWNWPLAYPEHVSLQCSPMTTYEDLYDAEKGPRSISCSKGFSI